MPESFRFTGDVQGVGLRKTLHRMLDEAKLPGLAYNDPYSDTVVAQIGGRAAARKKVIDSLSGYLSGRGQFTMEPIEHKEPSKKIELDDKGVRQMFERQNFDQALSKYDAQGLRNWIVERYRLKQIQDKLHGRVPLMAHKQLMGEEPIYSGQLTMTKKAGFQVAPSKIHGHGVFADTDMGIGDDLGLGLQIIPGALEGQPAFKRTTLGRYLNHTNDANAELFDAGDGMIHVRAIKPIAKADEVTLEYRSGMQCQQDVFSNHQEKMGYFNGSDAAGPGQSAVVPNRLVTGSGATPAGAENQPDQSAPNETLLQQAEMAPDDTLFDISSIKQATDLFMSEDDKTEEDSVGTDQGVEFTAHANNQMGVSGRRLPALLATEGSPGTYQPSGSNEAQGKSKQPAGQGILNRGGGYSAAGPMSAPPVVRAPETETTGSSAPMTGPKAVFGYG
jgi:acylphosphatase